VGRGDRFRHYDVPVIVALWITAIATSILALSGPVALLAWLSTRRTDRERRQREREDQAEDRIIRKARDEFLSKSTAGGVAALAVITAVIAGLSWAERKNTGRTGLMRPR